MCIFLWVLQSVLAFLFLSGGFYKAFKTDALSVLFRALSRGGWRVLGLVEMLGAVLLIVPGVTHWQPALTPIAAAVLALESFVLSWIYSRISKKLTAANPLVWSLVMGLLAAFVAYGRHELAPLS